MKAFMKPKLKYTQSQYIALLKEKHGDMYTYEKTVFSGTHYPIIATCAKHGDFEIVARVLMSGRGGCRTCSQRRELTTALFIERGRKHYGDRYGYEKSICNATKDAVTVTCPEHGDWNVTAGNHMNGKAGCPTCAGNKTLGFEEFVKKAKAMHGDMFTYNKSDYTNNRSMMRISCETHGEFSQTAMSHLAGQGCPMCAGKGVYTTALMIEMCKNTHGDRYNYELVQYVNQLTKIKIVCRDHGEFPQLPFNHAGGQGCPTCATTKPTRGHREISEFLEQHTTVQLEKQVPNTLLRLDMYLPEFNLGVEHVGNYYHSSARKDGSADYKRNLRIQAASRIRVLHIYEDEWVSKRPIVEKLLLATIDKLPKIFARKCIVQPVTNESARVFYNTNHLQGNPRSGTHLGLLYNGELVACMTMQVWRSNRTNTNKNFVELARYASTCKVVGGASRLLKAFTKDTTAEMIVSYSDNRIFSGKMYDKLGFTLAHQTPPDYSYITNRIERGRMHKSGFQKKHLVNMFPGCDIVNKTEWQICEENGFYRLYDCGKTRWDLVF